VQRFRDEVQTSVIESELKLVTISNKLHRFLVARPVSPRSHSSKQQPSGADALATVKWLSVFWAMLIGVKAQVSPGADVGGVGPVPVQMWEGWAQSRRRCGRGEPSPGADVAGVSPVPMQMWQGKPSPGADVEGVSPVPVQMWKARLCRRHSSWPRARGSVTTFS
jgi:hypothetical protein